MREANEVTSCGLRVMGGFNESVKSRKISVIKRESEEIKLQTKRKQRECKSESESRKNSYI